MARIVEPRQLEIDQTEIAAIKFDIKSRDDIPKILIGLQYIYTNDSLREAVFDVLEKKMLPGVDKSNGRPGMGFWKILVMGVLRLDLNCDYDRLHELVNQHKSVRKMLGHGDVFDETVYTLQNLKDNVRLLTREILEEVNQLIVKAGHGLLSKKKESEPLRGRCDSFVVETHVHYPTDISLLFDAIRKVIQLTSQLCESHGLSDWRQYQHNVRQVKKQLRITQAKKRTFGKTEQQQLKCKQAMENAHRDLIDLCKGFSEKAQITLENICKTQSLNTSDLARIEVIRTFIAHTDRQIDQVTRRVLQGERIPHEEKVFSLFQPHTEWINKGKIGVPVELGLRVCILEDQHQFILHHRVMEQETDDQVAVPMVKQVKAIFRHLSSCSFDKGFHSQKNQELLAKQLDVVALKRKGKLSQKAKAREASQPFKQAAKKHAAVESAINALEVHGLNKCFDHGIDGFKRYIALSVVARNIHRIGDILHRKEQKRMARRQRSANSVMRLAA